MDTQGMKFNITEVEIKQLILDLYNRSLYSESVGYTFSREVIAIAIEQIETVIGRLTGDKAFRVKYCQDPDGTLESYLSRDEIRAIKTGDGHALGQLGCTNWAELTAALCGPQPVD